MVSQISLALGAGTATLLLLLAALLFRDFRTIAAGRLAIAFALGSAAHASTASFGFAPPATSWQAVLIALSTGNAVVFWLDGVRPKPIRSPNKIAIVTRDELPHGHRTFETTQIRSCPTA